MNKPITYVYVNPKTQDEITLQLFPGGHFRATMDFHNSMSEAEMLKFAEISGYKLIKAPLRLLEKRKPNEDLS